MKAIFTKAKYILLIALTVVSISCSSEDGAEGPVGPQGPAGAQGPAGPQGPAGDGSNSVTTVHFEEQALSFGTDGSIEFNIPELTQDIFDNGLVYAYISQDNASSWSPLPFSLLEEVTTPEGTSNTSTIVVEILQIEVGKVTLLYLLNDLTWDVKFVLVEGNASTSVNVDDFL